ncbi:hypothetical protein RQP46_008642 [Phenoliferia psychrophenolica]
MPRPILSPGFFRAEQAAQAEHLACSIASSGDRAEWSASQEKDTVVSPSSSPVPAAHLAQRTSPVQPFTTDRFLDPASDEALVVKLAGLTRSLSPSGRRLVLQLEAPVLKKAAYFSEEYSSERVLTVKAWSRAHAVEGVCCTRVGPSEASLFEVEDQHSAGRDLAERAQALAAELGLSIPRRQNGEVTPVDAAELGDEEEEEGFAEDDDSDDDIAFDYEIEEVDEVEAAESATEDSEAIAMLSPSSAVFHANTLAASLGPPPPRRRSPPHFPSQNPTINLSPPPTRTGRTGLQGLGPGWADASRQSQMA